MMPGYLIVGGAFVAGAWGMMLWRMVAEASKSWEAEPCKKCR